VDKKLKGPGVIIAGCMKCGTTVLVHNMIKHPKIELVRNPLDTKIAHTELRFWNNARPYKSWVKGILWYSNLFKNDKSFWIEKCANYIEQKTTMKRIHAFYPDMKFIFCMRNPVDRAYSEFQMQHPGGTFTFETAKNNGYLKRGLYYDQLVNNIFAFFPNDQIYIVIQERMKMNTNEEINKVYEWLSIKGHTLDIVPVKASEATNRNLNLQKDKKVKSYKTWASKYPSMNKDIRTQLEEYFKHPNEKLYGLLGYNVNVWV